MNALLPSLALSVALHLAVGTPTVAQTPGTPDSAVLVLTYGWSAEARDSLILRRNLPSDLVGAGYGPRTGYRRAALTPAAFDSIVRVLTGAFRVRRAGQAPDSGALPLVPSEAITICELGPTAGLTLYLGSTSMVLTRKCFARDDGDPLSAAYAALVQGSSWRSQGNGP